MSSAPSWYVGRARFDCESVRNEALSDVLSLAGAQGEVLASFLPFVVAPEPVVELLPSLFVPERAARSVSGKALHEIAVAGKLLYAQARWLDNLADEGKVRSTTSSVYRLDEALGALICSRFTRALDGASAAAFFSSLARLNARYATSLALDAGSVRGSEAAHLDLACYVEHAKARAATVRAPVDAALLLAGAHDTEVFEARASFELCAAGLQLYDDAIDVEADFEEKRLSWIVASTLRAIGSERPHTSPDANLFYETALAGGAMVRNLAAAEELYAEAIDLADDTYPNWAAWARSVCQRARDLREDFERLVPMPGTSP